MNRFLGLMPKSDVIIHKEFLEQDGVSRVIIQAGHHGWLIIWMYDCSSNYLDNDDTPYNNFMDAMKFATDHGFELIEINKENNVCKYNKPRSLKFK